MQVTVFFLKKFYWINFHMLHHYFVCFAKSV